eukprot:scaffold36972_cov27-Prasinocladus_malaysianus.AAC.1
MQTACIILSIVLPAIAIIAFVVWPYLKSTTGDTESFEPEILPDQGPSKMPVTGPINLPKPKFKRMNAERVQKCIAKKDPKVAAAICGQINTTQYGGTLEENSNCYSKCVDRMGELLAGDSQAKMLVPMACAAQMLSGPTSGVC